MPIVYKFTIGKEETDEKYPKGTMTFSPVHEVELSDETILNLFPGDKVARLDFLQTKTCAIMSKTRKDLENVSSGMGILLDLQKNWDNIFNQENEDKLMKTLEEKVDEAKSQKIISLEPGTTLVPYNDKWKENNETQS